MLRTSITIELVIFDCDGVLVDSETLMVRVLQQLIARYGGNPALFERLDHYRGAALPETFAYIEAQLGRTLPADIEQQFRSLTTALFQSELRPVAGIHQALAQISTPYCVASICHS
jgi:beta-phosphoglucomutase-like phosphatase (HAD superfamily)